MFNLEKFFKEARSIRMTKEEKSEVLSYLVRNHPPAGHKLWSNKLTNFKLIFLKPMPIAIIIALLIGGGASAAAENALPGDTLYPVKVSVNEHVRGWLAISSEAEAKLQTKLAVRRLDEAEKLAIKDNLDENIRARLEANFQKHADRVKARISELEAKNTPKALEIASNLQASLDAHARILKNLETALNGNVGPRLEKIKLIVEARSHKLNEDRKDREDRIKREPGPETQAAAEGKLKAVENNIAEIKRFIASHSERFDAEAKAKAEAKLKLAEDILVQGKAKLEAKVFGEAFLLFQKAHSMLREVKVLLTAKVELERETPKPTSTVSPAPSVSGSAETEVKVRGDFREHNGDVRGKIRIELDQN